MKLLETELTSLCLLLEFVSCSEDRTVKVWSVSKPTALQTISIPAQSPWSIIAMKVRFY